jgi:hypothetical protein
VIIGSITGSARIEYLGEWFSFSIATISVKFDSIDKPDVTSFKVSPTVLKL